MPRSKFRLTMPKKKHAPKVNANTGAPTDKEWAKMEVHSAFSVSDDSGEEITEFRRGQRALVLPAGAEDNKSQLRVHEFWVAWIKQIRSRVKNDKEDVWVLVQWYYSPQDVADIIRSLCGKYERIVSDYYEIISCQTFSDIAEVKGYDESNLEQEDIVVSDRDDRNLFFARYTLEVQARRLSPRHIGTCLCGQPYSPHHDVMHFCPRPNCRRWYHRECLVRHEWVESSRRGREDRLLAASPDTDEAFPLALYTKPSAASSRGKGNASLLEELPKELLEVARLPITKGLRAGGLVGNIRAVVAARRIVFSVLEGSGALPEDWESKISCKALEDGLVSFGEVPPVQCPKCLGAI